MRLLICVAFAAFMVSFWFLLNVAARIGDWTFALLHRRPAGMFERALRPADSGPEILVGTIVVAMLLSFAFENHRDSDRSLRRAAGQLLGLAALVTVTFAAFAAAGRLL